MQVETLRKPFEYQGLFAVLTLEARSLAANAEYQFELHWGKLLYQLAAAGVTKNPGKNPDCLDLALHASEMTEVQAIDGFLGARDADLLLDDTFGMSQGTGGHARQHFELAAVSI